MNVFNLNGLSTPKSALYDNESAYKELLSRVNNGESIVVSVYTDRDNYPAFSIETKKVARFKVRVNQDLLIQLIGYLNNDTVNENAVKANEAKISKLTCLSFWLIQGSHRKFLHYSEPFTVMLMQCSTSLMEECISILKVPMN